MSTTTEDMQKEKVGPAIGRLTSGVYVVTVTKNGLNDGMLTTWLIQSAFEPPMLTFSVKKERPMLAHLQIGSVFAVNVLSKKNMDIFKNFAKPHADGLDRFEGLALLDHKSNVPVFSGCVAYMICVVSNHLQSGDHIVISGEITDGALQHPDDEPMSHLRKSGFQY